MSKKKRKNYIIFVIIADDVVALFINSEVSSDRGTDKLAQVNYEIARHSIIRKGNSAHEDAPHSFRIALNMCQTIGRVDPPDATHVNNTYCYNQSLSFSTSTR